MNTLSAVIYFMIGLSSRLCEEIPIPADFKFGVASAAYQVEGAWNVSDKGEGVWDRFTHTQPERILDGSNGDVACDSYNRWREDVELTSNMGAQYYRFSISWPRLLPNGFANKISEDGKRYYNDLIDGLLEKGIEPVVTLHHFDLPQVFQDLGGWTNPLIIEWFGDYASVVYSLYADRVRTWITINEPFVLCDCVYNGCSGPYVISPDVGVYLCNKNTLLAHARAWRIYDEKYKPIYHGEMSLSTLFFWFQPATLADKSVTDLVIEFWEGRYAHPIFSKEGGWPPAIEKIIAENSLKRGFRKSRLPAFTKEEIDYIRGTYDFYGLNHYTTRLVRSVADPKVIGSWPFEGSTELNVIFENLWDYEQADISWFTVYPKGLRSQLSWIKNNYGDGNIKIIITENGYPSYSDGIEDLARTRFYQDSIKEVLLAVKEDAVNVTGYITWCLMDNFEWTSGYEVKYGLHKVDFKDKNLPRTPRQSAKYLTDMFKSRVWKRFN